MWEFLATHLWTVAGALASLGGLSAVALFVFAGVPLAAFLRVVAALVDFLKTPLGQVLAIALAGILCFMAGDVHRTRVDAAIRVAEVRAAEQRDAAIKADVAADAGRRIADLAQQKSDLEARATENDRALAALRAAVLAQQSTELDKRATDYEHGLAASNACLATDDDVKRMRDNRAATARAAKSAVGLRGSLAAGAGAPAAHTRR